MNALLGSLQTCIESHFPGMAASLNPGASDADMDAFERAIGASLPSSVRALYRWHNGQAGDTGHDVIGLFFGLPFLTLDESLRHWKEGTDFLDDMTAVERTAASSQYCCLPRGTVRQCAASKAWIPLADDAGGAYLGIDLDPDAAGSMGQVISFGGREFTRVQAGASLEQFLERLLGLYENGEYALVEEDDDEFSLSTVEPDTDHFLDYLRLKAQAQYPDV
ncbi:SMI1/KNR4 family protein [Massilia scottii]|uniref:SMI1/KNR4 family protein n=1 Tax=Massilia scottii TaxID=3057166 RepID=UPI00279678C8|nr:SMI1/KNR4 family protein [Massilia sp. CCM 9029]MDQ1833183.1 SMI1/KNR4 family protein [Massilia sp. CCM 9029]